MININDIIEIDEKKKRIKKEIYTKIYDQFSSKIKQCVELGHKQVFLTVPVILIGYPVFDRNAATSHVNLSLVDLLYNLLLITIFTFHGIFPKRKGNVKLKMKI